jgi:N-methylhydantoinase A
MALDMAAAESALAWLAAQMGVDAAETAASGVIEVANAHMARAVRRISVERGFDPRRFTLVAFGGAGPLHACDLAARLEIPQVLVPAVPGVLSALGMVTAAPTRDYAQTVRNEEGGAAVFHRLRETALREMAADGHAAEELRLRYSVDMRYAGQSHELTVPWPDFPANREQVATRFHAAHEKRYGYARPAAAVEWVTARLTAVAPPPSLALPTYPPAETPLSAAQVGEKPVWFGEAPLATPLYRREGLGPGHRFPGPAIVFQYDTTTVIPPGWETAVDRYRNLRLTRSA